jgi:hypothetical protein
MMKMTEFYDDVLKGDLTRIKNRSPKFPEFVLQSAIQDGRQDVVDKLQSLVYQSRISEDVDDNLRLIDYVMLSFLPILISLLMYVCCFS